MSWNNDYAAYILGNQRQHELEAEAAERRLARIAQSGRTPWWSRLLRTKDVQAANGTVQVRYPRFRSHGTRIGAHHVAR
jgi:hypothetical protein